MKARWHLALLLFFILAFVAPGTGHAQQRIALVVGNGDYVNVNTLVNPPNDAADVSQALTRLGFQVTTLTNTKFDAFRQGLIDFGRAARSADMAIIFFAGHGMEITGENWLLPVDAELKNDVDVDTEAISLRSMMLAVSNAKQLGLVILDACRNNPFLGKMKRTGPAPAVDPGLAAVEPAENVLVAYAARDGTTASDGTGRNSPYTAALLRHIETPGLEIEYLFRNIRDDVMNATDGEQQPFVYGSLSSEQIYLKEGPPTQIAYNATSVMSDAGDIAWSFLQHSSDVDTLQRFVEVFPSSDKLADAKKRLAALQTTDKPSSPNDQPLLQSDSVELDRLISQTARRYTNSGPAVEAAWQVIKRSKDSTVLRRFSDEYPSASRRTEAKQRLTEIGVPVTFARDALLQAAADPDVLQCYRLHDATAPECQRALDRFPDIWLYVSDFRFRFELCKLLIEGVRNRFDECIDRVASLDDDPLFLVRNNPAFLPDKGAGAGAGISHDHMDISHEHEQHEHEHGHHSGSSKSAFHHNGKEHFSRRIESHALSGKADKKTTLSAQNHNLTSTKTVTLKPTGTHTVTVKPTIGVTHIDISHH